MFWVLFLTVNTRYLGLFLSFQNFFQKNSKFLKPFIDLQGFIYRKAKNHTIFDRRFLSMRKNIFKKSLGMILATGLMMASFTGCGGSESATTHEEATTASESTSASESSKREDNYAVETADECEGEVSYSNSSSAAAASDTEDSVSANYEVSDGALSGETFNTNSAVTKKGGLDTSWNDIGQYNTREYAHIAENDFISTSKENVSTFSADVDTASYSNIRGYINDGNIIPEDSVRVEEMINYFHYDYEEPKSGEPFSVNMEVDGCPWNENHQLVMIGLKAKAIEEHDRKPTNFVFLIDTSGSMNQSDKLPLVKCAFVKLLSELDENDTVSIVTYAGSDKVILEGESGQNTDKIASAIEELEAYGSTNGSAGINTAYKIAERYYNKKGNNRVILATDGDLNVGVTSESGLTELITEKKDNGIFLSVLGFGTDNLKDNKLEALADNGDGNYAFIDSVYEAKRVLVEEMGATLETVAKDVKLQTTFDEEVVEKYRLIGYENRMLAKEDFDDDSVDAGEIGSGHEVTALYEIVPTKDADISGKSGKTHILDLDIRYKEPKADDSKLLQYTCKYSKKGFDNDASDNMLWAESVACFGMFLKNSDYAGESSIDMARSLASQTRYSDDALRVEFMSLLDQAENIYYGRVFDDYGDYDNWNDYDKDYSDDSDVQEIEAN